MVDELPPSEIRRRSQLPAPVFVEVAVIVAAVVLEAIAIADRYWLAVVEQPASLTVDGKEFLVEANSWIEVLQAAIAATGSDIFERTT